MMKIVDVNYSSKESLLELDGIDSGLAAKIINGRPYICPNQLLDILGMSDLLLKSLEMQGLWVDYRPGKVKHGYPYFLVNRSYHRSGCGGLQ